MCDSWELDGGLLAKIDEYFQSQLSSPHDLWTDSAERSCSLGRHKRARIIDSPTEHVTSCESDGSEASGDEGEYQPECVVCNEVFTGNSEIGVPMTCIHVFCYTCIKEWSNRTNVCPICKSEFNVLRRLRWHQFTNFLSRRCTSFKSITQGLEPKIKNFKVFKRKLMKCLASVPSQIETVAQKALTEETEDHLGGCEICGADTDWEQLLLCDGCDLGFHIFCLNPPLSSVPQGDWFCKSCLEAQGVAREGPHESNGSLNTMESGRSVSIRRTARSLRRRNNHQTGTIAQVDDRQTSVVEVISETAEVASDTADDDDDDPEFLAASDDSIFSEDELHTVGSCDVITVEDDEEEFGGNCNQASNSHIVRPSSDVQSRGLGYPNNNGTAIFSGTSRGRDNTVDGIATTSSISRRRSNGSTSYSNITIDEIISESANRIRECPEVSRKQRRRSRTSVSSSMDDCGFEHQSRTSPNNETAIRPVNILADVYKEQLDELVEGRQGRQISFIYRYRSMMEQDVRSSGRVQPIGSPRIQGSSVRYIF